MRHMITMGIVPFTIELIIGTYYNLSYYDTLITHSKDVRHIYKKWNAYNSSFYCYVR